MDSNHRSRKTADLQSAPFGRSGTHPFFKELGASSRTRTNDRWITNLVLYQLSYRGKSIYDLTIYDLRFYSAEPHICISVRSKKRAKVLLFFDMTKYFYKKMQKNCNFVISDNYLPRFGHPIRTRARYTRAPYLLYRIHARLTASHLHM